MKFVKVPLINGLNKTGGCEKAFVSIFDCLKDIYSSEEGKSINVDDFEKDEIKIDNNDLEKSNKEIYEKAFSFLKKNEKPCFIGGDHSVSYSLTRAFLDNCDDSGKVPCLIVFDAHPDCMKPVDEKFPTHEEWLRQLVDDGFPASNVLLVGVRNSWSDELKYLEEKGIKIIKMKEFIENFLDTCEIITEFGYGKSVYVSLDIDVVDPAFAPGTGYQEIGGLISKDFVYLVRRIAKMKNLEAIDLVEINPDKDINNLTCRLGAKVLAEFY